MNLFYSVAFYIFIPVLILVATVYYFMTKKYNYWSQKNVKFVKPVPLFGNTLSTILRKKSSAINQQEMYNLFPEERFIGTYFFMSPFLMVRDPKLIHQILIKDFSHFYDRGMVYDEKLDLLSSHLVNLKGQKWKGLRSKLTPAFSSGKLKSMSYLLEECANALTDYLNNVSLSKSTQDMREIMAKFSTDVIGSCAFGLQFNSLRDPNSQFRKMGQQVFKPSLRFVYRLIARAFHPRLPYYLNLKILDKDVEKFFLDFVQDAIHRREGIHSEKKDFIQLLVELRNEDLTSAKSDSLEEKSFVLTDEVLASNAFVFFIAGFETTSSTMSFLLLELAAHLDIQKRAREEIIEALDKHNHKVDYDIIKDLPYLEMVISETLRKYPIAFGLLRECTQTYQVPDSDLVIEKGVKVIVPVYALHRDPKYFPEPERFDPERFSTENKQKIIQGTYLPFGDGPRICIGLRFAMMEMKYAFCKILPKYEFTLGENMKYPVQFRKSGAPLLAPEGGILLNVKQIDD
ncbi:probable cytochrome P450 6a14 [Macrosteles quadrilineatus]|uniref:probable cytochrome P450 6a14 n=1 Tax=Macrosteles quadrilineatus TaxID=74068 RepID=UPI0023E27E49|nr:probable cytochrome P450 6a14 [Macrosteles quadrilineatus]